MCFNVTIDEDCMIQGLKFSAPCRISGVKCLAAGKIKILHLKKKLVDITFESMSSPTNGMRGAQLSLSTKLTLLANQNFLLL